MLTPFDIELAELALATGSGRIVTRNGRPVTITEYNKSSVWAIHGIFTDIGTLGFWGKDGKCVPNSKSESPLDLFIEDLC